jgi:hypothetical protein
MLVVAVDVNWNAMDGAERAIRCVFVSISLFSSLCLSLIGVEMLHVIEEKQRCVR